MSAFSGFPAEAFQFVEGIRAHNDKAWFEANRALYDDGYVPAAQAFVAELGPKLAAIAPEVHFEPRINGSIMRLYRDVRFSKDKRPYKENLDMMFWHGDKRGFEMPGFWFRLTPDLVYLGVGMHHFERVTLARYRESVVHPRSGRALLEAVGKVNSSGAYRIGEKTRKVPPKGFATDPDRAEYLLYDGLTAFIELPAAAAQTHTLVDKAFGHYEAMWPIGEWLMAEVAE